MRNLLIRFIKKSRKILGITLFSNYIEETYMTWWGGEHEAGCKNGLSFCVDNIPDQNAADNEWHCCPYWQRRLTNKLTGRAFAIRNGVPVPELYWYGKDVNEIPFDKLPSSYVIKTSFGSGAKQVLPIVNGINILKNKPYTHEMIRDFFRMHMSLVSPHGYLIVEELLTPETGNTQCKDYKCHVFAGKVVYIKVNDRIKGVDRWYLRDWSTPPQEIGKSKFKPGPHEEPPAYYMELLEYAEKLGKAYGPEYVRIDFYMTNRGCVFGEFTATPSAGRSITPYADRLLGKLWKNMLRTNPMSRPGSYE